MPKALTQNGYPRLLRRIKTTIDSGCRKIEHTRALTYWNVGKIINQDILRNAKRAGYGDRLFDKLSQDTDISPKILRQTVQFHRQFPKWNARSKLDWSHYRALITVDDPILRTRLARKTEKNRLTTRQLTTEIRRGAVVSERGLQPSVARQPRSSTRRVYSTEGRVSRKIPKLIATKGKLYTYQLIQPPTIKPAKGKVIVDCGFNVWTQIPREGTASNIRRRALATTRTQMSYTYKTYVEKIIDGDTLWTHIEIGRAHV